MEALALFQGLCREEEKKLSLLGFLNRNLGGLLKFQQQSERRFKNKMAKIILDGTPTPMNHREEHFYHCPKHLHGAVSSRAQT